MEHLYLSVVRSIGPWVQVLLAAALLLVAGGFLGATAFWMERKVIQTKLPILWILPFPALVAGLIYGGLRFMGRLMYPEDGWVSFVGTWDYTYQRHGSMVLFYCTCLLVGVAVAVWKEKLCHGANNQNG